VLELGAPITEKALESLASWCLLLAGGSRGCRKIIEGMIWESGDGPDIVDHVIEL
jgi:hypothetical protein